MEKSATSTEPQGPRPVLGRDSVQVPDDQDFRSFRSECEAEAGWNLTYSKAGVSVWVQAVEMDRTLHKIKAYLLPLSPEVHGSHCGTEPSIRLQDKGKGLPEATSTLSLHPGLQPVLAPGLHCALSTGEEAYAASWEVRPCLRGRC